MIGGLEVTLTAVPAASITRRIASPLLPLTIALFPLCVVSVLGSWSEKYETTHLERRSADDGSWGAVALGKSTSRTLAGLFSQGV